MTTRDLETLLVIGKRIRPGVKVRPDSNRWKPLSILSFSILSDS